MPVLRTPGECFAQPSNLPFQPRDQPVLLCFSDSGPVIHGADKPFVQYVPGTRGQPYRTLARAVIAWVRAA